MAETIQEQVFLARRIQEGELLPVRSLSSACGPAVCSVVNSVAARLLRGVHRNLDKVVHHVSRIFANWQANLLPQV